MENDILFQSLQRIDRRKAALTDKFSNNLLHMAAKNDCMSVMHKLLTDLRLNPNTLNYRLDSPLMIAIVNGNLQCIKMLAQDPRTNINFRDRDGYTALYYAAKKKFG